MLNLATALHRTLPVLVLACGSAALGAPAATGSGARAGADTIRKALDQTVSLEVANQPLSAILEQLQEQTKVHFVLDRGTIQQIGLEDEQMPVTVSLKNTKVRLLLRTVLGPYNLGYAVVGDTVVVSTPEMAIYRQMRQPVNLDLDAVPLAAVIKQLARQTGANLLLDPRLTKEGQAPVTLQIDEVPLESAVRLLAELADLKLARLGNVLLVTTEARADKLRNEPEMTPPSPLGGSTGDIRVPGGLGPLPGPMPIAAPAAPAPAPVPANPPAEKKEDK